MPDITMCQGSGVIVNGRCRPAEDPLSQHTECPKKEMCFRFKATPSGFRQAYFVGIPYDPSTNTCEHFLPLYNKEVIERELP